MLSHKGTRRGLWLKWMDEYNKKAKATLISNNEYAIFIVLFIKIIKVNT